MEWTSLISDSMFDGIKSDLTTAVSDMLVLVLIVVGAGLLARAFWPK